MFTHSSVSATQCDAQGNVLFYANGMYMWDRNGNAMPNCTNPIWTATNVFGWSINAMIVPDGADTNLYYVFQLFPSQGNAPWGPYYHGQLTYSVVDMRLNGGMGDVVAGRKHILLDTSAAHMMTIVPGSNCDYWVVVQQMYGHDFRTYHISLLGIDTKPVYSPINSLLSMYPPFAGKNLSCRAGNLIYSYSRNKLIASYESGDICAYDLDPATGKVSNAKTLAWAYPQGENYSSNTIPAICLSPDESLLYASGYANTMNGFQVRQFPINGSGSSMSLGWPNVIFSTSGATYLSVQESFGFAWQQSAMQLGYDHKIYHVFTVGQNFLGRIENPNIAGTGCNFVPNAISLQAGTYGTSAMPAPMYGRRSPILTGSSEKNITVCFNSSTPLTAPDGYSSYTWQNGQQGKILNATTSGMYYVMSMNGDCTYRKDSFNVKLVNFGLSLGDDLYTCEEQTLNADAGIQASYLWSDGSANPSFHTNGPGTYWVSVTSHEGCALTDTVIINNEELGLALPPDTVICTGELIRLNAGKNATSYIWQDGSTNPYYDVTSGGDYSVTVSKGYCTEHADIKVGEEYCDNCFLGIPTAFTPNNDGRNDIFRPILYPICPARNYQLNIYNRFGQLVYSGHNSKEGWDGKFNGVEAEVGTYMYFMKFTGPQNKTYYHKGDVTLIR